MRLSKDLHIQPSEIDNMPFYWIEMLLDEYINFVENENERYVEMEKSNKDSYKTPNIRQPNIKMPNIPKYNF